MNIKKTFKKEKASMKRTFIISLIVMFLMPYMVVILNDEGIFSGWEFHFAIAYAVMVDLLLTFYLIKNFNEGQLIFSIFGRKIKIKDGIFKLYFSMPFDKVIYVDVLEKKNRNFDIVILMKKGKLNKKFINFNIGFVKMNSQYRSIYDKFNRNNEVVDYHLVLISKGGAKKFYLLFLFFKNAYNAEFSQKAIGYVKKFMEEYNMA